MFRYTLCLKVTTGMISWKVHNSNNELSVNEKSHNFPGNYKLSNQPT
jgi:hypothetical protein